MIIADIHPEDAHYWDRHNIIGSEVVDVHRVEKSRIEGWYKADVILDPPTARIFLAVKFGPSPKTPELYVAAIGRSSLWYENKEMFIGKRVHSVSVLRGSLEDPEYVAAEFYLENDPHIHFVRSIMFSTTPPRTTKPQLEAPFDSYPDPSDE